MKIKNKINTKNICFFIIILICIFALIYGVYYQVFVKPTIGIVKEEVTIPDDVEFDKLFDNQMNLQDYESLAGFVNKMEPAKDLVYTTYSLSEIYEGKYDIHVDIPLININNDNAINIDKEILETFYKKVQSIIEASKIEGSEKSVYTVTYTAYLNENILSLLIKATLKDGLSSQRVIIKAYTYNISTNEQVDLKEILNIRGISESDVKDNIKHTVENAINYSEHLSSLGLTSYKRDPDNEMYTIENSNNYFLGPNGSIYIIYAYGNNNFTTEKDIVYIK